MDDQNKTHKTETTYPKRDLQENNGEPSNKNVDSPALVDTVEKVSDKATILSFQEQRQLKMIEQIPKLFWFILLLVGIFIFSPDFKKLLDRAGRFKGYGVEIEFDASSFNVSGKNRTAQQDLIYSETFKYLGNRQQEQLINRVKLLQPIFQSKQFRILWVDDHPINNVYVVKILEQIGFRIETVTTSISGLELVNGSVSDTSLKGFDLVISDYSRDSKGDMNGLQLAEALKEIDYSIPIILYSSSYSNSQKAEQVFAAANRPDYLMNFILDVVERGDTPLPK